MNGVTLPFRPRREPRIALKELSTAVDSLADCQCQDGHRADCIYGHLQQLIREAYVGVIIQTRPVDNHRSVW